MGKTTRAFSGTSHRELQDNWKKQRHNKTESGLEQKSRFGLGLGKETGFGLGLGQETGFGLGLGQETESGLGLGKETGFGLRIVCIISSGGKSTENLYSSTST